MCIRDRCGAGTITEKVQEKAKENDLYFPIDFASSGSSQIGGNISTNAGGIHVIKYGTFKEWVIGLEVVLADGTVLNLNNSLIKNQTGYNLKSLFIGSEGTLGIVTAATLKLCPQPGISKKAFIGLNDSSKMLEVLAKLRKKIPSLCMCEYVARNGLEKVINHNKKTDPFNDKWNHYVPVSYTHLTLPTKD